MQAITSITINKKTDTYADALNAIGIAHLLQEIIGYEEGAVEIEDCGGGYKIQLPCPLTLQKVLEWQPKPLYHFVKFKRSDPVPLPDLQSVYDYEEMKEQEKIFKEFNNAMKQKGNKMATALEEELGTAVSGAPAIFPLIKMLSSMRMGSSTFNNLNTYIWDKLSPELIARNLGFSVEITKAEQEKELQKIISSLQIFNPASGKGIHRPKPDSSTPTSMSDKLVDWFDEWMKFIAMYRGMLAYNTGDGGKDSKIFVLAPQKYSSYALKVLHQELLETPLYGGTTKLDILAVLNTVQKLLKYSELAQSVRKNRFKPSQLIKGLYSVYFKNLGTASATMNISFLSLPGWFGIESKEDVARWERIVKEHSDCIRNLNDKHSEEIALLMQYREYLSTGVTREGLLFFIDYGIFFFRQKLQDKFVKHFTTASMEELYMEDKVASSIIKSEAFNKIASAIRQSTIEPLLYPSKKHYQVKHGLAQDWKRKCKKEDEFIIALSSFVQEYNWENTKLKDQGKSYRSNITDQDLKEVIDFIHTHGSELVGMLLLAFGFAVKAKTEENGGEHE